MKKNAQVRQENTTDNEFYVQLNFIVGLTIAEYICVILFLYSSKRGRMEDLGRQEGSNEG